MIILQQDKNGQYVPKLDANGNLFTIIAEMSAKVQGSSSVKADLTLKNNQG